jgi:hypothetical protein
MNCLWNYSYRHVTDPWEMRSHSVMLLSIVLLPLMAHAFPATGHRSWIDGQDIAFRGLHLQLKGAFVLNMPTAWIAV